MGFVMFFAALVFSFNCFAVELHVDIAGGDDTNDGLSPETAKASIQAAIDIAANGDQVLVWPGTYYEEIDFSGKEISVASAAKPATIDGGGGFGVLFFSGEGSGASIKNFIITNCNTAVSCYNSTPKLEFLTIVGNQKGVDCWGQSDPFIHNCIFWYNSESDIEDAGAFHSCIERVVSGTGNISEDPLFVDPYNDNYFLQSQAGRISNSDPYDWSDPELLEQLNTQYKKANSPSVSRDGLEIYYNRNDPDDGYGRIFVSTRESVDQPFGNERKLTELITAENDGYIIHPWLSADGLRLYYSEYTISNGGVFRMAQRPDLQSPWTPVESYPELQYGPATGAFPSLTEDELAIFWQDDRPGSESGKDIWMATRYDVNEVFSNIVNLSELDLSTSDEAPCVMPDGLTLYFISKDRGADIDKNIYKAVRPNTQSSFGNVEKIEVPGIHNGYLRHFYVQPNESEVYFSIDDLGIYYTSKGIKWEVDEQTSPCIDKGNRNINPMAEPRPNGGYVNMGAYGGTAYASKSPSPWPNKYDDNQDGTIDIADFAEFAKNWMWQMPWYE